MSDPTRITVTPSDTVPYDVVIGEGLLGELAGLLDGALRVAVVHPRALRVTAETVLDDLRESGFEPHVIEVPDGEDAKTLRAAEFCWEVLGRSGFTRTDAVVGLGGGAVTDLAGFVAATWLRGIRVVHVPTTTSAMVDAALGGKTAINTAAGKNLVGAFHSPAGVLCDLAALATLPVNDHLAGLAEVIKTGFVGDPGLLAIVEADPAEAVQAEGALTRELVERSVRVKAAVVSADLRDTGLREVLNYGHTLGHAVEKVERYTWRHGAAVSVGLVFAAALGRASGRLDDATADRHRAVLSAVGLPTGYPAEAWPRLLDAMRLDKKARGATLRFVILDGLARPGRLEDPAPELLAAAWAEVAA